MTPSQSSLVSLRTDPEQAGASNLNGVERLVSGFLGGWLVARGLRKGGVFGLLELAAGGMAIARGGSGQCNAKRALSPTPYESQLADEHHWGRARALSKSITVNRPRDEVYRYWRDFSNMPTFMEFIEQVEARDDHHAHWVARVPMMDKTIEWDTYIAEDVPGERLAWMSEADAPVRNLGWVTFRDAPNGSGTEIHAVIAHEVPGGRLGYALARGVSKLTGFKAEQDLRRFKQLMETGEISTGQMNREPADKHTGIASTGEAR
ncbi:SRPBCC family protein [Pseudomonas stutzeri]|uniref:Cyclase/dehydrase n=1 Tax=Stutzerimonas stutzeri TaxID=316 RepID=A0A2N8S466_STUST|nr:SRPBCC family protein [Stutzerimonas stutzeri]MCQ4294204.1 SRPBCC family protein [Stutzerimonas stutzeri]PNF81407.1 cyclase/dehydrase [Stutzerimonas stutzeri]